MKGKRFLSLLLAFVMVLSLVGVSPTTTKTVKAVAADQLKENTNYLIVSKKSGKALTIVGYSQANNAGICQRAIAPYEAQVWTLDGENGEFQIVNKFSGKSLNVPWASTEAGTEIVQFNKENSDNSKWLITDEGNGYCRITPKMSPDFGLNIEGNSDADGALLIQWNYAGADNELWEFREVAEADIQPNPGLDKADVDAALDAYLDIFIQEDGGIGNVNGFWAKAETIEVLIDAYERYQTEDLKNIMIRATDWWINDEGTDWEWNDYNDDIMWGVIMCARVYKNTGIEKYKELAKNNFDMCYDRAWTTDTLGGGLIWNQTKTTKNACVNGPGAIGACLVGDITGDNTYYDKAKGIIEWEAANMLQEDGGVKDSINWETGDVNEWKSTYNQGTFIGACTMLHKHFGEQKFYDWAKLAADYSANMGDAPEGYLNREDGNGDLIGFKGILARWLSYFAKEYNLTDYNEWMQLNADAAWTNRNSDNLMWTQFGRTTLENIHNLQDPIEGGTTGGRSYASLAAWGCSAGLSWLVNCADIEERMAGGTLEGDANWEVTSPDGNTAITVKLENGKLKYSVKQGDAAIVEESDMGINTSKGDFTDGLTYKSNSTKVINETYKNYSGIKAVSTNHCTEATLVFEKGDVEFQVIARAYNDGIAFRYYVNSDGDIEIDPDNENTSFTLPDNSTVWYMNYAPYADNKNFTYEKDYEVININDIAAVDANNISEDDDIIPTMPMLYKTGDTYVLITEAQKSGSYVGSMLKPEGNRVLRTMFDKAQTTAVKTTAPFQTPWRAMVIGDLAAITSNTMTENLSPAPDNATYNFDEWVEPGVSSWSWVANWGNGISDQSLKETHMNWIDLAAEMGWKYYIMDEGWQPRANKNGTRYEGFRDWWPEVKAYAESKGIKLIAWVHKGDMDTAEERESRFKEWSEQGIVGIKVDFFDVETQAMLQLHEDIYKDAAEYHMLVNVHGSNPPSGERRTYPNVLAREAIKGQEQGGITAEQYTLIPFIRAAVGTADVTEELYSKDQNKTSMGWQIALSVLVENGIRSLGGEPSDYLGIPAAISYYKNFPEKWDDVKLLDSAIGEYVNIARKTGEAWYAAGISVNERDVIWTPDFLDAGKNYTAIIYKEVDGQRQNLAMESIQNVTKNTQLTFHMQNGGGYAVKLIPNDGSALQDIVVSSANVTVQAYYTKDVKISYVPENTTLTDVEWEVADSTIAKVTGTGSGVIIKGLKEGTTTVTVKSSYTDVQKTINVTVTEAAYDLADGWTILNDDKEYLFTSENSVEILSQNGVVYKNVFVRKAPEEDFEISMKVSGGLLHNYQGGFVGVFSPGNMVDPSENNLGNNYVAVGRRYHTGFDTGGDNPNNHFAMMSNGEFYCADDNMNEDAYVKLVKKGNVYTGYYSFNGNDWTQIVDENDNAITKELDDDNLYIGFYAGSGGSNDTVKITFTDFKLNNESVNIAEKGAEIQPKNFTVTFDSAGGTDVEAQIVAENGKVTKPADPTRENYEFLGWYRNDTAYDFENSKVNADITLVAKWKASIETQDLLIEAETGVLAGNAQIVTGDNANDSFNGSYVGNIGVGGGTVSFTVNAETEGTRILKVYYASWNARQLSITVNGNTLEAQNCLATGGWDIPSPQPLEIAIELKEGTNTIVIGGVNGAAGPNVDRIEIALTNAEAVQVVNNMIDGLPADLDNLSNEDKAKITAVQLSYDSLGENKSGVSEEKAAKLESTVAAAKEDGNMNEEDSELAAAKEELAEAIQEAEKKNQDDYTEESWNAYQELVKAAKAVYEKNDATLKELQQEAAKLEAAADILVTKEEAEAQAKEEAKAELDTVLETVTANNHKEADYTAESWAAYQAALEAAKAVQEKVDATAEELTAAANLLKEAETNLVKKSDVSTGGTTGENNGGTTGGNEEGTTGGNEEGTTGGNEEGTTGENNGGTTGGNSGTTSDVDDSTTVENVTQIITSSKTDKDIAGSTFADLRLRVTKSKKNANKLKWNKVKGAKGYLIFANKCGSKLKLVKNIKSGKTKSWQHKKLKKGTYYKYMVVAYKTVAGKQTAIATSKIVHVPTTGGKYTDIKSVKVNKTKVTLKKNKTFKIKAKEVKKDTKKKIKRHRKLSYESTNVKIATVSKSGKIKAKAKGTCYIYVYAQNGAYKRIKVTVK